MDRGASWAIVHGVAKSQTRLNNTFSFTFLRTPEPGVTSPKREQSREERAPPEAETRDPEKQGNKQVKGSGAPAEGCSPVREGPPGLAVREAGGSESSRLKGSVYPDTEDNVMKR